MGFIDENLMKDENVIHRTKLHWIIFFWPIVISIFGVLLMISNPTTFISYFLITVAIFLWLRSLIMYSTSEFGITDKRVLIKTGFIQRNSHEILLSKIEAIKVNQGILGRMLDFGTISVTGTGGTQDPFSNIVQPLEFRKQVQEQISKAV